MNSVTEYGLVYGFVFALSLVLETILAVMIGLEFANKKAASFPNPIKHLVIQGIEQLVFLEEVSESLKRFIGEKAFFPIMLLIWTLVHFSPTITIVILVIWRSL